MENRSGKESENLGTGLPGHAAEALWSLPAAGGQVEDGGGGHVGGLCILAVVVGGRCGVLRKAPRCTLTGRRGLRE